MKERQNEQTKYFTKRSRDLVVVTNHKPLVKKFGDCALNEIQNTQIFKLKQCALPRRFEVQYMPSKTDLAADAASRYPNLSSEIKSHDASYWFVK